MSVRPLLGQKEPVYCSNPPSFLFKYSGGCVFTSGQFKVCLKSTFSAKPQTRGSSWPEFSVLHLWLHEQWQLKQGFMWKKQNCSFTAHPALFGMGWLKSSSYISELFSSGFPGCLEHEADALNWGGKNRSGDMSWQCSLYFKGVGCLTVSPWGINTEILSLIYPSAPVLLWQMLQQGVCLLGEWHVAS